MPTISVILPCYNGSRYVREAVESVFAQTFGDFELILVDDGSTDDSLGILREYEAKDQRIKIISRPNTGLVGALNDGILESQGEFLARMDADDICLPVRFQKQVDYLREHPECAVVGCRVTVIDPYGVELFVSSHQLTHEEIEAELLNRKGWALCHPTAMMRREAVIKAGGYRSQFECSEEVDLFLRLADQHRLANLPEPLLRYRQHLSSISKNLHARQAAFNERAARETFARRGVAFQPRQEAVYEPEKPAKQLRDWAWRALKVGRKDVARKHAKSALWLEPINKESWRVLLCAIRGH